MNLDHIDKKGNIGIWLKPGQQGTVSNGDAIQKKIIASNMKLYNYKLKMA